MKTIVIGDVHGLSTWKRILDKEVSYDKLIFLGDYVDSFNVKPKEQLSNLNRILSLYDNKTIRCIGNHELNYVFRSMRCSGYNPITDLLCSGLIQEAIKNNRIVPFHIDGNMLFSHAGVTNYWLNNVYGVEDIKDIDIRNFNYKTLEWNSIAGYSGYGDTISNGLTWVRPRSLLSDKIEGYIQIVGHTGTKSIIYENDVYFCDTIEHARPEQYLVITDSEIEVKVL